MSSKLRDGHRLVGIPDRKLHYLGAKNWGMAMVVRTGPADFNIRLMATFRQNGMRGHAYGGVTKLGPHGQEGSGRVEVDCPDERTVFDLLDWPYREPWERF